MNELEYMNKWLSLNTKMSEQNFTWGTLEEDDDYHQYMSFDIVKFSESEWNDIKVATERIGSIVNKAYKHIMQNKEKYLPQLGLPKEALGAVEIESDYFSYFTRLDLVKTMGGIKLIEINCDTPTGYLETSVANSIICEDNKMVSPNNLEMSIFKAWRKIEKDYNLNGDEKIYFTSYGENEEDKQTVLFNMKNSGVDAKYIAVEDIRIDEYGIYDTEDNEIEYLYRLYPLEFLPTDEDENGAKIGEMLLNHIASGKVKIINPPSAFVMQSKAVMAIIWNLFEQREGLFDHEELMDISRYFLPTYFTKDVFEERGMPYVRKPIFGREGGGVHIFDENSNLTDKDEENWYDEWSKIYQSYVEMPNQSLNTWIGEYEGKLLLGSFLIGGEASGLFLRVGEKITGNLSMFCGVAVE